MELCQYRLPVLFLLILSHGLRRVLLESGHQRFTVTGFEKDNIPWLFSTCVLSYGVIYAVFPGNALKIPDAAFSDLDAADALILAD